MKRPAPPPSRTAQPPRRRPIDTVARHPLLGAGLAVLTWVIHILVVATWGAPLPQTQDEFSYLLAADTFAHGRLTNPPHPMWQHFETFQVLSYPTYQSKYPPGQGLILALGQVVLGARIFGAGLAAALAVGTIHWALRAWLPPRWALVGGLVAVMHPLLLLWGQNFWGGALGAGGGALLIGAFRRLWRRPHAATLALFAVGLVILANTRPYEGLVLAVLLAVPLALQHRRRPVQVLRRLPWAVAILAVATAGMMAYNWRVTGRPLRLPYVEYESQYAAAPPFVWQPAPSPKDYRHPYIRHFQIDYEQAHWRQQRSPAGWLKEVVTRKAPDLLRAYVAPATLALPLLAALWATRRRRWARRGAVTLGLFLLAAFQANWMFAHYAAPATALFFYLVATGLRNLWTWRSPWHPRWRAVARGAVAIVLLAQAVAAAAWACARPAAVNESWGALRAYYESSLTASGGRHLVFVRYGPQHSVHIEWVYNPADIDAAPVVWARDMGDAQNRKLMAHYPTRTPWLLHDDRRAAPPEPYTP